MSSRRNFFQGIYRHQAERYDRLVAREDAQGKLFGALNEITPLGGLKVVEFGAGTGRLTRLLVLQAAQIRAFDIEPAMLRQLALQMRATGMGNWAMALGDNCLMPLASDCADLVIEGWSFAHVREWHPQCWRQRTDVMLREMERIAKPGGAAVLIETLGTGKRRPQPSTKLAELYQYWQEQCGFQSRWIRTDFQFASPAEADELTRFFFGDALADDCLAGGGVMLPECTGIWWKHFS